MADDHALVREALAAFIRQQPDMEVVGMATTNQEALEQALGANPDVVCLDISMPGGNGLAIMSMLRQQNPGVNVLVLTQHEEGSYLRSALAVGCAGYVLKSSPMQRLLEAIRTVAGGAAYIDEPMRAHLADQEPTGRGRSSAPADRLSERERQVLEMLVAGLSYQDIAAKLGVSVKTIETYRTRLANKLGFRSRADLVSYALAVGILKPSSIPTQPVTSQPVASQPAALATSEHEPPA